MAVVLMMCMMLIVCMMITYIVDTTGKGSVFRLRYVYLSHMRTLNPKPVLLRTMLPMYRSAIPLLALISMHYGRSPLK